MRKRPFFLIGLASFLCVLMSALFSHTIGMAAAGIVSILLLALMQSRRLHLTGARRRSRGTRRNPPVGFADIPL